jgi:hypothetical protein
MPCLWWLIFFIGSLLDYASFVYRTALPQLVQSLPLSFQRFFLTGQLQQAERH